MEWYEAEVAELVRRHGKDPAARGRVIFYGSSSVRLWSTLEEDFPELAPLNLGFGGSTLAACVHFAARLLGDLQPARLVVYAGENDIGDGVAPSIVAGDMTRLLHTLTELWGGLPPSVFISLKPSPARWGLDESIRACNALLEAEVGRHPEARWVNLYPAMLDADGRPEVDLYAADGLHLSRAGYRLWTREIRQQAGEVLGLPRGIEGVASSMAARRTGRDER